MNNTFSPSRLMRVINKMWRENWRGFMLSLVLLGGSLALMIFIVRSKFSHVYDTIWSQEEVWERIADSELAGAAALFFIFGIIAASMMFGGMSSSRERIQVLMTPASTLEKFTARWLTFTVGYVIAFVLLLILADLLNHLIYSIFIYRDGVTPPLLGFLDMKVISHSSDCVLIGVYLIFTAAFALGSAIWPRKALLKTFFALFVIVIVYAYIASWVEGITYPASPDNGIRLIYQNGKDWSMEFLSASIILATGLYTIAYFRFKESEVIDRW